MIANLMGHMDYLHILLTLRRCGPLRFSEIQNTLKLNPNQVDRALKVLRDDFWIIPRTIPTKSHRVFVEYELSHRGEVFLCKVVDPLRETVRKNAAVLGAHALREVQSLYR